jgi:penicillin-binding protein 1B
MRLRSLFRLLGLGLLAAFILGLIGLGIFAFYLDIQVTSQFEGRRFALPARVYARPLELFTGARVSAEEFARELGQLDYREGLSGEEPGRFTRNGGEFELVTRPFAFWDGKQAAQPVRVVFEGNHVVRVQGLGEREAPALVRLDPEYIGGIYPGHNEDRVLVKLDEVPPEVMQALIAVEDRSFYTHMGVDPRGIARAFVSTVSGEGMQGGSTLTQQLVKNFFLTPERTLKRKVTEMVMAVLLERHYSKEEILETYINEIYLGQDRNRAIHGFGLAAQYYFDKPLKELTLTEAALLVGIVKGPSYYDPRRHADRALERRNVVLASMREVHYITDEDFLRAKLAPLGVVNKPSSGTTPYPAFLDLVRRQLLSYYREEDLRSEGLQIFTTLDPNTQAAAEKALSERLASLEKSVGRKEGAEPLEGTVIVAHPQNGEVQALVGGRDPRFQGFNRALDSRRPIGSLMKPAVYLAALSEPKRYTLMTPLDDEPMVWKERGREPWEPRNYDKTAHGKVALRTALANSYNMATAQLGLALGMDKVIASVHRLGVERDLPPYAATVLGAVDLSPLEVAQMYQTLSSGGFRAPLRAIREVLMADGTPLQHYNISVEQTVEPGPAYLLTVAMQDAVREGTARGLVNFVPAEVNVAGKTGTTDDLRDSWFAGFTGDRVAVAWVGYDDNRPTRFTGASGAMTVWGDLMARLAPEPLDPPVPEEVETVAVDPASGLRAGGQCVDAVEVPFIRGSAPAEAAPCAADEPKVKNWFLRLFD